jgi:glycosyltransferase involved in cell wall biosynthesis
MDLYVSFEKTKVGGLICGHDYSIQHFPDVVKAVDEFCLDKNLKIEFISNDGCPTYSIRKNHNLPSIEVTEKSQTIKDKNNMHKRVNVIIPTYKRYNLLREALDSVLKQTYKNINVIVVADGADEFTKKIVTEYDWRDENIRFNYYDILHEGNLGSAPRIYGIDQLDEEGFVCFLDDDNIMNPDYVEKMVGAIEDSEKDISICRIYINHRNESIPQDENNIKHGWIDSLNILVPNKIAKLCKDKWNQVGENVTHDFDFITTCLKHGRIHFIPLTLGVHRYTEPNYVEEDMTVIKNYDSIFKKNARKL